MCESMLCKTDFNTFGDLSYSYAKDDTGRFEAIASVQEFAQIPVESQLWINLGEEHD